MKPEAELAAGGDITVQDGLPSKPGHNNIPVKEESSAATANCSTFACERWRIWGCTEIVCFRAAVIRVST